MWSARRLKKGATLGTFHKLNLNKIHVIWQKRIHPLPNSFSEKYTQFSRELFDLPHVSYNFSSIARILPYSLSVTRNLLFSCCRYITHAFKTVRGENCLIFLHRWNTRIQTLYCSWWNHLPIRHTWVLPSWHKATFIVQ